MPRLGRTRLAVAAAVALISVAVLAAARAAGPASITVQADRPGINVSPTLYGIFFEEINRAGDGGIYAELVQNRSFEDAPLPIGWLPVKSEGAEVSLALDRSHPLNANNPTSLRLEVARVPAGGRAGVANVGFRGSRFPLGGDLAKQAAQFDNAVAQSPFANGIPLRSGRQYRLSLYARADSPPAGPLSVTLEKADGTIVARQQITGIGSQWQKFSCSLTSSGDDPVGRLVLSLAQPGTLWLDMVSLFPADTFKGHPFRADLTQMLADMHPAFVRFPGGCYVEGDELAHAFRWKKTIGDVAQRPGHYNLWQYYSNDGLGYHEYLQLCEDLGAEPLYVINCGMAHKDHVPLEQMQEFVDDALDAIEYANGPAASKWGALRAAAGHPAPFHLKFMEIGNENGGPLYEERYALFYKAIKQRYPEVQLVADGRVKSAPMEIVDEHYYNSPEFFMRRAVQYDSYDRAAHRVYVGEYAVTQGAGKGNLMAALGEAAFMTGLERNSDVVAMASYAPLLENVDWKGWNPNAIQFDSARCLGTPSYHVQALFGRNRADVVLPCQVASPEVHYAKRGRIGVGTWLTQAEFKDIRITAGDKTLWASDFVKHPDLKGWQTLHGHWEVAGGVIRQTSEETDVRAVTGRPDWTDYTLSLKARKIGGREGFLVMFQVRDVHERIWWNIGGWGNRAHGVEGAGLDVQRVPGHIETGRWYDIRIETHAGNIKCYLDGKLIHDISGASVPTLFAVAGRTRHTGEIILKVVNTGSQPLDTAVNLEGGKELAPQGRLIELTSASPDDENSLAEPAKIVPHETPLPGVARQFRRTFPAWSVSVLRLKEK